MPGLVPGIHDFLNGSKTWMAGTSPAMTRRISGGQPCASEERERESSLRHGLVGNVPVVAVEDRDVERLHRRVIVRRVAVADAVEEERRVEAVEVGRLFQHILAREIVAAAAQDLAHG